MSEVLSTKKLTNIAVHGGKKMKRIGKVRSFVFHPSERRVLGALVKRPDAALMFHRKDLFIPVDRMQLVANGMNVEGMPDVADAKAVRDQDVDWDACVLWVGMPLVTSSGERIGYVYDVIFEAVSGNVVEVVAEAGLANDAVLGRRNVPASLIRGFKRAKAPSGQMDECEMSLDAGSQGAILVADEAASLPLLGGAAAAAGKATALIADKAKKETAKAKEAIDARAEKTRPARERAAAKVDEAVQTGAYAVGERLGRTSGMFGSFKDELQKALHEDEQ